jgi:hypothetical protein
MEGAIKYFILAKLSSVEFTLNVFLGQAGQSKKFRLVKLRQKL